MNGKLQSIAEITGKIKRFSRDNSDKIYHIFELSLTAAIFFGIGILFAQTILYPQPHIKFVLDEKIAENNLAILQPSNIKDLLASASEPTAKPAQTQPIKLTQTAQTKGEYVASKNGKTYYKTSCSNRIKDENKIYFQSESDAQKSGFTPSKTCFK